ncbi:Uma2 family endonuclease [Longimonas halophila]|nr:Uma2 family endonuclease [Longimonas halophila]
MPTIVDAPHIPSALDAVIQPVLPMQRMRIQLEDPLSDEAFQALCAENEGLSIEQNPDGTLTLMSPTGGTSGARNFHIYRHLAAWIDDQGGGFGFDSSTMFKLPNGAHRAPDVAWVAHDRFAALSREERDGFVPLAPDFVIELRSPTDPLDALKNKMNEYMHAGVRLGWLIDPETETVSIYAPDTPRTTLDRPDTVTANTVIEGFALPMARIWDPLAE